MNACLVSGARFRRIGEDLQAELLVPGKKLYGKFPKNEGRFSRFILDQAPRLGQGTSAMVVRLRGRGGWYSRERRLCLEGCKKPRISQWELKWLVSQKEVSFLGGQF